VRFHLQKVFVPFASIAEESRVTSPGSVAATQLRLFCGPQGGEPRKDMTGMIKPASFRHYAHQAAAFFLLCSSFLKF